MGSKLDQVITDNVVSFIKEDSKNNGPQEGGEYDDDKDM